MVRIGLERCSLYRAWWPHEQGSDRSESGGANCSSWVKAAEAARCMEARIRGLRRFQVKPPFLAPALKQNLKDAIYFALDFAMDRLRRFFSAA